MGARVIAGLAFIALIALAVHQWQVASANQWVSADVNAQIAHEHERIRKQVENADSLPPDDPRRLAVLLKLADCDWQENKLDEAAKVLADLWTAHERNQRPGYDADYAATMLMMAGVHRDQGEVEIAEKNYEQVYYYDLHHLDADTPKREARDLNNLGVAHYLVGLSRANKAEEMRELSRSLEYFKAAQDMDRCLYGMDSQYEANVLYNESLPLRDIGKVEEAETALGRSNSIMALVARPCKLP